MNINFCTFTGVDEATNLDKVLELSNTFPFIEWGVLFSMEHAGSVEKKRYMSMVKILEVTQFFKANPQINGALHLCGEAAYDFISNQNKLLGYIEPFKRIQLNIVSRKIDTEDLKNIMQYYGDKEFITQHNSANEGMLEGLMEIDNHSILFDASGGRGITPTSWPKPIQGKNCGYAGGMGAHNIKNQLELIEKTFSETYDHKIMWLDMESNIRNTEGLLDLSECEKIAKIIEPYTNKPIVSSETAFK